MQSSQWKFQEFNSYVEKSTIENCNEYFFISLGIMRRRLKLQTVMEGAAYSKMVLI